MKNKLIYFTLCTAVTLCISSHANAVLINPCIGGQKIACLDNDLGDSLKDGWCAPKDWKLIDMHDGKDWGKVVLKDGKFPKWDLPDWDGLFGKNWDGKKLPFDFKKWDMKDWPKGDMNFDWKDFGCFKCPYGKFPFKDDKKPPFPSKDGSPAAIPAPGTLLLGSIGVGLVGWLRRRRTL